MQTLEEVFGPPKPQPKDTHIQFRWVGRPQRQWVLDSLPKGGVGAEIGVWKGEFSRRILVDAEPKKLFLIDPWEYNPDPAFQNAVYGGTSIAQEGLDQVYQDVCDFFEIAIQAGQVEIIRKRSSEAWAILPELDFVYIDGDHTYDGVMSDLLGSYKKVRIGGLICGDDCGLGGWWGDSVVRAVNDLVDSHPVTSEINRGQYILRKVG